MRLLQLTQHFLLSLWDFLRLPFPGTDVAIGAILIFPTFVSIALAFFRNLFGVGGFAQVGGLQQSYRSASKRNPGNKKGK